MGAGAQFAPSLPHSAARPILAMTHTGDSPALKACAVSSRNTAFMGSERMIAQFHWSFVVTDQVGASSVPPTRVQLSRGCYAMSSGPSSTAAD